MHVEVPVEYQITKNFKDWIKDYSELNLEWCQEFIEECMEWDGSRRTDTKGYYYSSVVENNTEVVQTVASLSGYRTNRYIQVDNRKDSYKNVNRLSILKHNKYYNTQSVYPEQIDHNGRVYCVSVPSGMILIRRNNCIAVSGNCHLSITQNLINILRTKEEEGFFDTIKECEEEAIKMFAEAANEEKAWANYLFKDGSILGLNAELLGKYIEWLVDSRMSTIGLPKIFNTKNNGLGTWVTAWMESEKVQVAPQESGITNYRISAGNNDVQTMIFESEEL